MARTTATATSENHSDNLGVEGPTDDPPIRAARDLRKRNLLATLMLCQGMPMLLAGDEIGNSQGGNNNAYAQDNETGWIDWDDADLALAALRRAARGAAPCASGPAPAPLPACAAAACRTACRM